MQHECLAEGIDLYCADARAVLPLLAGQAAAIVTDPPYKLTSGGARFSPFGGVLSPDRYANDGQIVTVNCEWHEWLPLAAAACRRDADLYIMSNDKNLRAALNAVHAAGLGIHNVLVWDKGANVVNRWYMKQVEFTVYAWKGDARTIRNPSSKQLVTMRQTDAKVHPTIKPVALLQMYLENSTDPGELVIDPFCGSGTTGVAAVRAGRHFVGIELEPRHFETAVARISAAIATAPRARQARPPASALEQASLALEAAPQAG